MNIAEDILKYNLQNVYFLIGTACGGKTTMARAIASKYGFIHFNDNYHEANFSNWQAICDKRYKNIQPKTPDWEYHFNRPPKEYNDSLSKTYREYVEYAIIEIIKLAQNAVVIADTGISCDLIKQIAPYNRAACLLAAPEVVVKDYFERDDHRDIYECIMSLKEPEKALRNMENVLKYGTQNVIDEVQKSGLFYIMRDANSSVENTLSILEQHFGLHM